MLASERRRCLAFERRGQPPPALHTTVSGSANRGRGVSSGPKWTNDTVTVCKPHDTLLLVLTPLHLNTHAGYVNASCSIYVHACGTSTYRHQCNSNTWLAAGHLSRFNFKPPRARHVNVTCLNTSLAYFTSTNSI